MALVNDIVTRLYLNGDWRDVSSHVRAEQGITYQRGRRGQDDTTPPASCTLTLDNGAAKGNGAYTEQNPMGTYYGYLGRFTPAEVKLRHVRDTATTTASNGWGSTDTHSQGAWNVETWTTSGTSSDFSKSSGKMNVAVTAVGQTKIGYLASYRGRDVGVAVTWSSTLTNVTGPTLGAGVCPANILLRGQGALSSYIMLRIVIQTDETIVLDWWDQTNASITSGFVSTGLTYVAGTSYRVRAEVEGRTLRAKIWAVGTPEPYGWLQVWVDELGIPGLMADAQGWVGIRTSHTGTNTNGSTTYSYDDFEVYSFVAAGEVSEWPQGQDVTARDQTVRITINGPRGRLATAKTIARSALYQKFKVTPVGLYNPSPVPYAYFPLEDGKQTAVEFVREATGGSSRLHFEIQPAPANTTVGSVEWAADSTRPGSKQSPAVKGGGALFATINPPVGSTTWEIHFQAKFNYTDGFLMSTASLLDANVTYTRIRLDPESTLLQVDLLTAAGNVLPMISIDLGSKEYVEQWHTISFSCADAGAFNAYSILVDGNTDLSSGYSDASTPFVSLAYINLGTVDNSEGSTAYGHLAVFGDDAFDLDAFTVHDAAVGNIGERPVFRARRTALEYGYEFGWIGYGGATGFGGANPIFRGVGDGKQMGAQRVVNVTELLNDAEALDGGILYEQRSVLALQFRTLASMSARSSWITFDVGTSKHVSGLQAVPDDRELCNRFTAQRADGGSFEYSLDSGPMSTLPPNEGGVGVVDRSASFNVVGEGDLPDLARFRVAQGTVAQERYPSVVVELHRPAVYNTAGLISKLNDLDIGDQVTLDGLTSRRIYDVRDVVVMGISGRLDLLTHTKTLMTTPAELTRVAVAGSTVAAAGESSRVDSDATTIDEDLTTTETDVTIEVAANSAFWVNSTSHANRFPFDVVCGGERMTVTAGTAPSGQNQTWTVTRSVNGVVKTHSAGAKISLYRPNYVGL